MDQQTVENFLSGNREKLAPFATSLVFFQWAEIALSEGMEPEQVFYQTWKYNLEGGI